MGLRDKIKKYASAYWRYWTNTSNRQNTNRQHTNRQTYKGPSKQNTKVVVNKVVKDVKKAVTNPSYVQKSTPIYKRSNTGVNPVNTFKNTYTTDRYRQVLTEANKTLYERNKKQEAKVIDNLFGKIADEIREEVTTNPYDNIDLDAFNDSYLNNVDSPFNSNPNSRLKIVGTTVADQIRVSREIQRYNETGRVTKNHYDNMVKVQDLLYGVYSQGISQEEWDAWEKLAYTEVKRWNPETHTNERVRVLRPNAPLPPLKYNSSDYDEWFKNSVEEWKDDDGITHYSLKKGSDPEPLRSFNVRNLENAWNYYKLYSQTEYYEQAKADDYKHTAGAVKGAVDSPLDVMRYSVSHPTTNIAKNSIKYLDDYLWNPFKQGKYGTLLLNSLIGLGETSDIVGVGSRALLAGSEVRIGGTKGFEGTGEFWYDVSKLGKENQKKLIELGADKLLKGGMISATEQAKIHNAIVDAGLWDEWVKFKTAYASYSNRNQGTAVDNLKKAYTEPGSDYLPETGNTALDLVTGVVSDPTFLLSLGAAGGYKVATTTAAELAVDNVIKTGRFSRLLNKGSKEEKAVVKNIIDQNIAAFGKQIYGADTKAIRAQADSFASRLVVEKALDPEYSQDFADMITQGVTDQINNKTFNIIKSAQHLDDAMNKYFSAVMKTSFAAPYLSVKVPKTTIKLLRKNSKVAEKLTDRAYNKLQDSARVFYDAVKKPYAYNASNIPEFIANINRVATIDSNPEFVDKAFKNFKIFSNDCAAQLETIIRSLQKTKKLTYSEKVEELDSFIYELTDHTFTTWSEFKSFVENELIVYRDQFRGEANAVYESYLGQVNRVETFLKETKTEEQIDFFRRLEACKTQSEFNEMLTEYERRQDVFSDSDVFERIIDYANDFVLHDPTPANKAWYRLNVERATGGKFGYRSASVGKYKPLFRSEDNVVPKKLKDVSEKCFKEAEELHSALIGVRGINGPVNELYVYMEKILKTGDDELSRLHSADPQELYQKVYKAENSLYSRFIVNEGTEDVPKYSYKFEEPNARKTPGGHQFIYSGGKEKQEELMNMGMSKFLFKTDEYRKLSPKQRKYERNVFIKKLKQEGLYEDYVLFNKEYSKAKRDFKLYDSVSKLRKSLQTELSTTLYKDERLLQLKTNRYFTFEKVFLDKKILDVFHEIERTDHGLGEALHSFEAQAEELVNVPDEAVSNIAKTGLKRINSLKNHITAYKSFQKFCFNIDPISSNSILTQQQYYDIVEHMFGNVTGSPEYFNPKKFIHEVETLSYAKRGQVSLSLDSTRKILLDKDSEECKDLLGRYYNEYIENEELQNRVSDMLSGGHLNPENDVNVQILQYLLRYKDGLEDLNVRSTKQPVCFVDIETTGFSLHTDNVTYIAMKKWKPVTKLDSLEDILNHIDSLERWGCQSKLPLEKIEEKIDYDFLRKIFGDNIPKRQLLKMYCNEGYLLGSGEKAITQFDIISGFLLELEKYSSNQNGGIPCIVVHNNNGFDGNFINTKINELDINVGLSNIFGRINSQSMNTYSILASLDSKFEGYTIEQKNFLLDQMNTYAKELIDLGVPNMTPLDFEGIMKDYTYLGYLAGNKTCKKALENRAAYTRNVFNSPKDVETVEYVSRKTGEILPEYDNDLVWEKRPSFSAQRKKYLDFKRKNTRTRRLVPDAPEVTNALEKMSKVSFKDLYSFLLADPNSSLNQLKTKLSDELTTHTTELSDLTARLHKVTFKRKHYKQKKRINDADKQISEIKAQISEVNKRISGVNKQLYVVYNPKKFIESIGLNPEAETYDFRWVNGRDYGKKATEDIEAFLAGDKKNPTIKNIRRKFAKANMSFEEFSEYSDATSPGKGAINEQVIKDKTETDPYKFDLFIEDPKAAESLLKKELSKDEWVEYLLLDKKGQKKFRADFFDINGLKLQSERRALEHEVYEEDKGYAANVEYAYKYEDSYPDGYPDEYSTYPPEEQDKLKKNYRKNYLSRVRGTETVFKVKRIAPNARKPEEKELILAGSNRPVNYLEDYKRFMAAKWAHKSQKKSVEAVNQDKLFAYLLYEELKKDNPLYRFKDKEYIAEVQSKIDEKKDLLAKAKKGETINSSPVFISDLEREIYQLEEAVRGKEGYDKYYLNSKLEEIISNESAYFTEEANRTIVNPEYDDYVQSQMFKAMYPDTISKEEKERLDKAYFEEGWASSAYDSYVGEEYRYDDLVVDEDNADFLLGLSGMKKVTFKKPMKVLTGRRARFIKPGGVDYRDFKIPSNLVGDRIEYAELPSTLLDDEDAYEKALSKIPKTHTKVTYFPEIGTIEKEVETETIPKLIPKYKTIDEMPFTQGRGFERGTIELLDPEDFAEISDAVSKRIHKDINNFLKGKAIFNNPYNEALSAISGKGDELFVFNFADHQPETKRYDFSIKALSANAFDSFRDFLDRHDVKDLETCINNLGNIRYVFDTSMGMRSKLSDFLPYEVTDALDALRSLGLIYYANSRQVSFTPEHCNTFLRCLGDFWFGLRDLVEPSQVNPKNEKALIKHLKIFNKIYDDMLKIKNELIEERVVSKLVEDSEVQELKPIFTPLVDYFNSPESEETFKNLREVGNSIKKYNGLFNNSYVVDPFNANKDFRDVNGFFERNGITMRGKNALACMEELNPDWDIQAQQYTVAFDYKQVNKWFTLDNSYTIPLYNSNSSYVSPSYGSTSYTEDTKFVKRSIQHISEYDNELEEFKDDLAFLDECVKVYLKKRNSKMIPTNLKDDICFKHGCTIRDVARYYLSEIKHPEYSQKNSKVAKALEEIKKSEENSLEKETVDLFAQIKKLSDECKLLEGFVDNKLAGTQFEEKRAELDYLIGELKDLEYSTTKHIGIFDYETPEPLLVEEINSGYFADKMHDALVMEDLKNRHTINTNQPFNSVKLSVVDSYNYQQFTKRVSNKLLRQIKDISMLEEYSEEFADIIRYTKKFAADSGSNNPLYYLKDLNIPERAVERYAVAQQLYDDILKYTDYNNVVKYAELKKDINFLPSAQQGLFRAYIEQGSVYTLSDNLSKDVLDILDGEGHDLIYKKGAFEKNTPKYKSRYTNAGIEGKLSALLSYEQLKYSSDSLEYYVRKIESSTGGYTPERDYRIRQATTSVGQIQRMLIDIAKRDGDEQIERIMDTLKGVQNARFKAYSNQILDYITKSEDNLIQHLLFNNRLLIVPMKGTKTHVTYATKLLNLIRAQSGDLIVWEAYDGYLWIGLKKDLEFYISGDSKHIDGDTIIRIGRDGKEYREHVYDHIPIKLFPDDENIALTKTENQILDYLEQADTELRGITNGASAGSIGMLYGAKQQHIIYDKAPKGFISRVTQEDLTCDSRWYHSAHFNRTCLGDLDTCFSEGLANPSDIVQTYSYAVQASANISTAEKNYITSFFGTLGFDGEGKLIHTPNTAFGRVSEVLEDVDTYAEKYEILKNCSDENVVVTIRQAKTDSGFEVKRIPIKDELSVKLAEASAAIIVPYDVYLDMVSVINTSTFNQTFLKIWTKLMFFMKVSHLCNPGTWMRNWIDATIKATGESGSFGETAFGQVKAMQFLYEYNKISKWLNDTRGVVSHKYDELEAVWEDVVQRQSKTKLTYKQYQFMEGWLRNSISGGESAFLKHYMKYQEHMPTRNLNLKYGSTGSKYEIDKLKQQFDKVAGPFERFEDLSEEEIVSLINELPYWTFRNLSIDGMSGKEVFLKMFKHELDLPKDSPIHSQYEKVIYDVLEQRGKRINKSNGGTMLSIDRFCSSLLKPMSQVEQVVRLGQFFTLESQGMTRSRIFKSITDSQFNYELKSNKIKGMELVVSYFNFEINNISYWCKQFEDNPRMLYYLQEIWGELSWDAALDANPDEDYVENMSLAYMMQNGGIPIGDKGMYLKTNPSFLSALNWFYGGPSQYINKIVPPLQTLSRYFIKQMGSDYAELFNNMGVGEVDENVYLEILKDTPVLGTMYTRYYKHFHDTQPWERIDGSIAQQELVKWCPTIFGAVQRYNQAHKDDFDKFLNELAKDGKWYDQNRHKVVPLSEKNELGMNSKDGGWDATFRNNWVFNGKIWDSNVGAFVKLDDFTPGGLNRNFDFENNPDDWDDYCYYRRKYKGEIWDKNQRAFVSSSEYIPGMLNSDDLTFEETCEYNEKLFGTVWDNNQGKFVQPEQYIPGGLNSENMEWDALTSLMLAVHGKVWDKDEGKFVQVVSPLVKMDLPETDLPMSLVHINDNPASQARLEICKAINNLVSDAYEYDVSHKGDFIFNGNLLNDTQTVQRILKDKGIRSLVDKYTKPYNKNYHRFRHGFSWRSYSPKPKVNHNKKYGSNVLSINGKAFSRSYTSSGSYSGLRMAVSGYKAYDEYYKYEYNHNYSYRCPNPRATMKRYTPRRMDHSLATGKHSKLDAYKR